MTQSLAPWLDHPVVDVICVVLGIIWMLFDFTTLCFYTMFRYLLLPFVPFYHVGAALLRVILFPYTAVVSYRRNKQEQASRDFWIAQLEQLKQQILAYQAYRDAHPGEEMLNPFWDGRPAFPKVYYHDPTDDEEEDDESSGGGDAGTGQVSPDSEEEEDEEGEDSSGGEEEEDILDIEDVEDGSGGEEGDDNRGAGAGEVSSDTEGGDDDDGSEGGRNEGGSEGGEEDEDEDGSEGDRNQGGEEDESEGEDINDDDYKEDYRNFLAAFYPHLLPNHTRRSLRTRQGTMIDYVPTFQGHTYPLQPPSEK